MKTDGADVLLITHSAHVLGHLLVIAGSLKLARATGQFLVSEEKNDCGLSTKLSIASGFDLG